MNFISKLYKYYFINIIVFCFVSVITTSLMASDNIAGNFSLKVYVVDDLKLNPVPLLSFNISKQGDDDKRIVMRTDESGKIITTLPDGDYLVENIKPVIFKGKNYQWSRKVTIEQGKVCEITLTDEDAITTILKTISTEGELYKRYIGGIVTVESDSGHGTGFIVDQQGLIMTNSHVVENSNQFVVKFGPGQRYPAILVEKDTAADVAILLFARETNPNAPVIPLFNKSDEPLAIVGDRVCAIGSPLDQEQILTTGIISKVSADAIISDVNINPGNSGGPLLNMNGEVIGLNTFAPNAKGPGYAGIVPISKALPVLIKAKEKLDKIPKPEARHLPDFSPIKVPVIAMEVAAKSDIPVVKLKESLDDFEAYIYTPMIAISQSFIDERKMEKQHKSKVKDKSNELNLEKFKDWQKQDAVVIIRVAPLLQETRGSKWGSFFSVVITGADIGQDKYNFRDDFKEMSLFRGNNLVEPLRRTRRKIEIDAENANAKALDYAYEGVYSYDPMVFEPTNPLIIKVNTGILDKKKAEWVTIKVDAKVQKNIWESFALWRLEVEKNIVSKNK